MNWPVCGIPEILYTDHGCDFTSKHIEEVCVSLKIQLIFSTIGKPRGRGKIERFFFYNKPALSPGFTRLHTNRFNNQKNKIPYSGGFRIKAKKLYSRGVQ